MPPPYSLETIVGLLDQHHQRATYAAVGALVGVQPRAVMLGLPKEPRYSWVVNGGTGAPLDFTGEEVHPALTEHPRIIGTMDELMVWIEQVRNGRDQR